MSEQEIEDLGLTYREEVELSDIVVTYSAIGRNDNYRLYASKIKKKGTTATPKLLKYQKVNLKIMSRRCPCPSIPIVGLKSTNSIALFGY